MCTISLYKCQPKSKLNEFESWVARELSDQKENYWKKISRRF